MNYYLSVFIFLSFTSCISNQKKEQRHAPILEMNFTTEYSGTYETLNTDALFSYPVSMVVTDSLIIVMEYNNKHFFHAINKFTGKLAYEFMMKGNGPSEVLSLSNNFSLSITGDTLYTFDEVQSVLYLVLLDSEKAEVIDTKRITEKGVWIKSCNVWNDDISIMLGCNGPFLSSLFAIKEGKKTTFCTRNPNWEEYSIQPKGLCELFYGPSHFRFSRKASKAAFATYKGGLLEFFDTSDLPDSIRRLNSFIFCPPYKDRELCFGFEDICATCDNVYTLYNGKTGLENELFAESISVFDWEGSEKYKINLNIDMRCLCVDEDTNILYAIAYNVEDGFILIKLDLTNYSNQSIMTTS